MIATAYKLEILQEYSDWRDQVELAGIDSSLEAYREHLERARAREALSEIRAIASTAARSAALGDASPSALADTLREIANITESMLNVNQQKEIAPA